MRLGIITYDHPHLKTEQLIHRLLFGEDALTIFALPWVPRPPRRPHIPHRPDQTLAIHPEAIAAKHGLTYHRCATDMEIDGCDAYLIGGARQLSEECALRNVIYNCHPGILPAVRGLDAFKWTIAEGLPLGVTLHRIDPDLDAGEIVATIQTPVYADDSLSSLARRHYEAELTALSLFRSMLTWRPSDWSELPPGPVRKRMPRDRETAVLMRDFPAYRDQWSGREAPIYVG